jgi:hypothetical protein
MGTVSKVTVTCPSSCAVIWSARIRVIRARGWANNSHPTLAAVPAASYHLTTSVAGITSKQTKPFILE